MLSPEDRAVLELEARFWKTQGAKEEAIRRELALTPVRYYQRLARLAHDPAAQAVAPATLRRVRELARGPRRLG